MGIIQYTLFAFALTAAISYLVIALLVAINKAMSKMDRGEHEGGET